MIEGASSFSDENIQESKAKTVQRIELFQIVEHSFRTRRSQSHVHHSKLENFSIRPYRILRTLLLASRSIRIGLFWHRSHPICPDTHNEKEAAKKRWKNAKRPPTLVSFSPDAIITFEPHADEKEKEKKTPKKTRGKRFGKGHVTPKIEK